MVFMLVELRLWKLRKKQHFHYTEAESFRFHFQPQSQPAAARFDINFLHPSCETLLAKKWAKQ